MSVGISAGSTAVAANESGVLTVTDPSGLAHFDSGFAHCALHPHAPENFEKPEAPGIEQDIGEGGLTAGHTQHACREQWGGGGIGAPR